MPIDLSLSLYIYKTKLTAYHDMTDEAYTNILHTIKRWILDVNLCRIALTDFTSISSLLSYNTYMTSKVKVTMKSTYKCVFSPQVLSIEWMNIITCCSKSSWKCQFHKARISLAPWDLWAISNTRWQKGKRHLNIATQCHRLHIDLGRGDIHHTHP